MRRDSELEFRTKLDAAREWEKRLAAWVRGLGYYVIPTYDFSGVGESKAPKLLAPPGSQDLVLPDLLCWKDGRSRWLECKWKTEASFYRKGGYLTTGISTRLWSHYERVEKLTSSEVVLAFLHEKEGVIRGGSLAECRAAHSHIDPTDRMQRGGMHFFRFDDAEPLTPKWGKPAPASFLRLWAPLARIESKAA
jgi:hypothetical protein